MSRAALLDSYYLLSCALVLTLFLFQKGQGFFPPLPIAALLPRSWRWADSNGDAWDASVQLRWLRSAKNRLDFYSAVGINHTQIMPVRIFRHEVGYFCNTKGQRDFKSTMAFYASHEARCRMVVFPIQRTRSHTRPASRGTCRATAVKPRPSRMSHYAPARYARRSGCRTLALL